MTKAPILVVEDEEAIRIGLCDLLAFHGYAPTSVETGEEGLRRALGERFALVVLDVMLPGMDGFTVCRELREKRPEQAILLLTARGAEADVLAGFRAGADDYVTKPFSLSQLVARVAALLRRTGDAPPEPETKAFELGSWRVDPEARSAACAGGTVELSPREVELLALFARERGRIVGRRLLLREVWRMRHVDKIETRTVDVHIAKLRKKLAAIGRDDIETVRGEGYRFAG